MTGSLAIEYLTRTDWRESRLGLERVEELLSRLGYPHHKLKFVHVAGTNGKGSVCSMLASVLTEAGYKTGLYTSPFINDFNERIQISGKAIDDEELARVAEAVRQRADTMADHPTEFELITVIAFQYFLQQGCDIVVLEVGLGGRLDATNIIPAPEVAVITPISYDHMAELGDSVEKIAAEKGGIIKKGCVVVASPQEPCVQRVLKEICAAKSACIEFLDAQAIVSKQTTLVEQRFSFKGYDNLTIRLLGKYQLQNAAVVVSVVEKLQQEGWAISESDLRMGLARAQWPARFDIIHQQPTVIVDGGHNPQCVDCLVDNLHTFFPGRPVTFITGVMADKDFKAMFSKIIPLAKRVFTVTPNNPRALDAVELAEFFYTQGVHTVKPCDTIERAMAEVMKTAEKTEVICAFGSFYMAGAIRKMFGF